MIYFLKKVNIIYILIIIYVLIQPSFGQPIVFDLFNTLEAIDYSLFESPVEQNEQSYEYDLGDIEKELAEKFAPIIHKHPEDYQSGLADYNLIIKNHSTLHGLPTGFKAKQFRGTIHHWNTYNYKSCSLGQPYTPYTFWQLDIDDDVRYTGAEIGKRPLYYHCYKYDGYYYLQYWYFFTMNDISDQTNNNTWHEGDWEHVSIKIEYKNGVYIPLLINFYGHEGGHTVDASQAWWSTVGSLNSYQTIQQGYDEEHTHLHIWIAKNSHASYNRWDNNYNLDVNLPSPLPQEIYFDEVDYSTLQLLFDYNYLVNMGEVGISTDSDGYAWAHDVFWQIHYFHQVATTSNSPIMDGLAYIGFIGDYWAHSSGIESTRSPQSPYLGQYHEWRIFSNVPSPGFGNDKTMFNGLYGGEQYFTYHVIPFNVRISHPINIFTNIKNNQRYTFIGYEARNTIEADGIIEGDGTNGANVLLRAGKSIHLKPGFHAQRGSTFHAYIDSNLIE